MKRTDTIIIGGGQAGLAMSRCLLDRKIDHVVLERGRLAQRWRSERWDSLRLLTPNWQSRLPGWRYRGADPHGYMTMPQVVQYFEGYARSFDAPLQDHTAVLCLQRHDGGYRVTTDQGTWQATEVVIATGQCDTPLVPEMAKHLPPSIHQLVPGRYRNPDQLPDGGVLVVGASASGLQLAEEIRRSGRPVTLAVGRHTRLPRCYRGQDILWWFDRMGIFDETADDVHSVEASRRQPSMQLVGRPDHGTLDIEVLRRCGVRLVGRATGIDGKRVAFADDLAASTATAQSKMSRLLARIDHFIAGVPWRDRVGAPDAPTAIRPTPAPTTIDLKDEGIETVLWATGFCRRYPWLRVPVLDARGEIRHRGGFTPVPGLYVLGLQFLRRRKSSFIDGVGDDARDLADHIAARLARRQRLAA